MKYIDLFAGVGGFHYGIDRAFSNQQTAPIVKIGQGGNRIISKEGADVYDRPTSPLCVYSNEWDKYANECYRKHFGECDIRDIREVPASDIPDHDLLVGGFPCQAFSIAGKRRGFDETRGTLFFEIARILAAKQPRLLLLENVKGLLSHDGGRTFEIILATLDELGYDLQWQVLNSKDFGVPQNRERVFIIGHLRGTPRPEVFPITKSNRLHPREVTQGVSDAQRIYESDGIAKTLKGLGGGLGAKTGLYTVPMQWRRTEKGKLWRRESQKRGVDNTPFNHGYRELVPKDSEIIGTITSQAIAKDSLLGVGESVRRLTPLECERLQGFPDNWTEFGVDGEKMSDTQRYKMCGNAVTTNVVAAIAEKLL
jgi:DNA (cytosine-5)-methyltransferase 1